MKLGRALEHRARDAITFRFDSLFLSLSRAREYSSGLVSGSCRVDPRCITTRDVNIEEKRVSTGTVIRYLFREFAAREKGEKFLT